MRLLRVQIPEFRALKDVDISFDPNFTPQVFPLGSLNGGGKSTFLQLVFVLLSLEPDLSGNNSNLKHSYFKYLLSQLAFDAGHKNELRILATITLLSNQGQKIVLNYFYGELSDFPNVLQNLAALSYFRCTLGSINFGFLATAAIDGEHLDDLPLKSKCMGILSNVCKQVFLISPSNQSYLFAPQEGRRLLYTSDNEKSYDQVLKSLKNDYHGFFTYDFINVLTEVCRLARDKDFDERLKTGIYGTHYEQLENGINSLFIDGKKIVPLTIEQNRHTKDAIQSMGFLLPSGEEIYPEDLSHGELKRLAIFVLFKYFDIQNSIVLMDEIENAFHPDWQYQIVRDLVEWGDSNQYILATHSYELCNALTPAHVKELEPKLVKN
ncbi:MAG: AAA family ATPase [Methylococcales bacterium]|nr:AAA family ATPase [Methylococcales bacterium]